VLKRAKKIGGYMPNKDNIHVVPHNGEWAARREGNEKVSKCFETQREANNWSKNQSPKEVLIHNRQGVIRERNTYGIDPCPPRDKR
jgi:hypothetical protein